MLATEEQIISHIGPPGTPLRRPKGKDLRLELARLLEPTLPAELQLRAYLALGKRPPIDLLREETIARSLTPKHCLSRIPNLASKVQVLDAGAVLKAILKLP